MTNGRSIFLYERQTRMAGTILGNVATGASSWVSWISAMEKTRKGFLAASLTNPATTAASSIATGSVMELSGSFYTFTDTAITLAAGTPSAAQAVYYTVIPSAGGTTVTVVMEGTAPTWVDSKQGYYTSAASLTRYIGGAFIGTAATYYGKWLYDSTDTILKTIKANAVSRMRVTKNDAQSIPSGTVTVVQYDDEEYDNLEEFASYRFTAKEAGYYFVKAALVSATVTWTGAEYWYIKIYKNGALHTNGFRTISSGLTDNYSATVSDIIYLAVTEYIDIRCLQNQGAAVNTSATATNDFFAVHRLS